MQKALDGARSGGDPESQEAGRKSSADAQASGAESGAQTASRAARSRPVAGGRSACRRHAMGGLSGSSSPEKELANAKLPPPPEEDYAVRRPAASRACWPTSRSSSRRSPTRSMFPMQAVFEKEGKPVVYVKNGSRV